MRPSPACLEFVRSHEGFVNHVYADAGGKPTVGYGHLVEHGEMLRYVSGISQAEALALLEVDLERIGLKVDELTAGMGLRQCEYDALVCLAFNIGPGELGSPSCSILPKLGAGDIKAATDTWLQYDHCAGKVLEGLRRRREAEVAMFLGRDTAAA